MSHEALTLIVTACTNGAFSLIFNPETGRHTPPLLKDRLNELLAMPAVTFMRHGGKHTEYSIAIDMLPAAWRQGLHGL